MKNTKELIESFINGNISTTLPKLKKKTFETLIEAYKEVSGESNDKANMFALYIKGGATFQNYCDVK